MTSHAHRQLTEAFNSLIQDGIRQTIKLLGFDSWTCRLSSESHAYGFCIPERIFDADSYEVLSTWLTRIFAGVGLGVTIDMRRSSEDEDGEQLYGSIVVGPHLHVDFYPLLTVSSVVPVDPPNFGFIWLLENTTTEGTNQYNVRILHV